MKLKKFFEKKRNVFIVGFIGTYLCTFLAFQAINYFRLPVSLKLPENNVDHSLTIKEQTIYEGNDVLVRQIGFNKNSVYENELTIEVTNNSDTKYYVKDRFIAVNKIMSDSISLGTTEVLPDTTTLINIPISMEENNSLDITKLGEIVFDLDFYTDPGGIGIDPTVGFIADDISVQTNYYKDIPDLEDINGKLVYNQDNILVAVNEESLFEENKAQVSIQNNNDEDIVFVVTKFTVDGQEVDDSYKVDVRAHSRTTTSELQLNYTEDISQANLSVEAIAGVYGDDGTTILSKPYKIVWK